MKKIKLFFLFILMIFGLASCTSPEYSFNEITGLEINYYAVVDPEAVVEIVDELGGVEINVPQRTYAYYESGERMIPPQVLVALAQFYHVSVDYILGLTDQKTAYPHRSK